MDFFKRIGNEFTDLGQNIKNVFAPNQKPVAEGKVLSDGSVTHNIDLSEFEGQDRVQAEKLIGATVNAISDMHEKASEARVAGDTELANHYDARLEEAEKAFTQLKWELEHRDVDATIVGAAVFLGPLGIAAVAMRDPDTADRIVEGREVVGHFIDAQALGFDEPAGASGTGASGDAAGAGAAGGGGSGGIFDKTPAELAQWFESDPQDFFAALRGLSSEERGPILMMVQSQIQQTNQLFSMLSNFQSAMHDTQKAMVSNMRV